MRPEERLHRSVAEYLNVAITPPAFWTTFPSGWFKGRVVAAVLRACGLRPGVPDLLFIRDGRAFWIELKAAKGVLSDNQDDTQAALEDAGCEVATCSSVGAVEMQLRMWGFALKARAAA